MLNLLGNKGELTFYELVKVILEDKDWRDIYGIAYIEGDRVKETPLKRYTERLELYR